jgi:molybdate transport system regulatory protein
MTDARSNTRLTLRVDFGANRSIGPGKVRLLEAIDQTGSISQAGRALGMSYRRAWLLIDDMNQCFNETVTTARPGGSQGGGAELTPFGKQLIRSYRAIESAASGAAKGWLGDLEGALKSGKKAGATKPRKIARAAKR